MTTLFSLQHPRSLLLLLRFLLFSCENCRINIYAFVRIYAFQSATMDTYLEVVIFGRIYVG